MMKIIVSIELLLSPFYAKSRINIVRYNDKFSNLNNDTVQKGFDKIKYIRLLNETKISFDGELS